MKKNNHNIIPFKEHLKKILLKHSFTKIIEFEIICIFIAVSIGLIWGIHQNHQINQKTIVNTETILETYDNLLTDLKNMNNVMVSKLSTIWRHHILKKLYIATSKTEVFADLYVIDKYRHVYVSNCESISEEEKMSIALQWKILDKIKQNPNKLQIEISKGNDKKIFLGKGFIEKGNLNGYLVLKISEKEFHKVLGNTNVNIAITDPEHWTLFSNPYQFIDKIGKLEKKLRFQNGLIIFENHIYYIKHQFIGNFPLLLYSFSDYTRGFKLIRNLVFASFFVLLLFFWIGYSNVEKLALEVSTDIQLLNEAFLEVSKGNLDFSLNIHSSAEFENIGNYFNKMRYSFKKQMLKNKELAEEVAYEQIKLLRSQFKSHFLFNTLDNIRFICKVSPQLADHIIVLLSKLLRYNTTNQNEKVTISEDFDHLEMYFEIIKIRFGDAFKYHIHIEETIENCLVIKSLVQPLVENSIKYGLKENETIEIAVSAQRNKDQIQLSCQDNGPGINLGQLEKIQNNLLNSENKTIHLGLYNINRRVQLIYGDKYGLTLKNNQGLLAQINIPLEAE